ncbi:MAG: YciI family protein [Caulobacteraceae bacterium]
MQYMLLIHADEAGMQKATPEDMQKMMGAYTAYTQAMRDAGVLVAADRLKPSSTASTVRVIDGKTQVLDGPYAEAKEQLAGYYLIEAPDLDSALAWPPAVRAPASERWKCGPSGPCRPGDPRGG